MIVTQEYTGFVEIPPMFDSWVGTGVQRVWNKLDFAVKELIQEIVIGYPGFGEGRGAKITVVFSSRFIAHVGDREVDKIRTQSCVVISSNPELCKIDPARWTARLVEKCTESRVRALISSMLQRQATELRKDVTKLESHVAGVKK